LEVEGLDARLVVDEVLDLSGVPGEYRLVADPDKLLLTPLSLRVLDRVGV